MNDIDKKLDSILEVDILEGDVEIIEPEIVSNNEIAVVEETMPAVIEEPTKRDVDYDYEHARNTHHDLLEQGQSALPDLLRVAKESQHPRAYEVAAGFLKTLSDMTDKLMTLHKVKKDLDGKDGGPPSQTTNNIDKAVFVGSTSELLKQIKNEPAA